MQDKALVRNQISLDDFYAVVIQKGIPQVFTVTHSGDDVQRSTRVAAYLTLKVPYKTKRLVFEQDNTRTRYNIMTFSSAGLTIGHALQDLLDQIDREVI